VIRKLRASTMPPVACRSPIRPRASTSSPLWKASSIAPRTAHPNPGRPTLHRLNRAEYANAIRDILDLNIDAASLLPPDDFRLRFDNISDALGLSPSLQEHYLSAALKIGALAVGDPHIAPGSDTWRIKQDLSQNQHIEGMPLGTSAARMFATTFLWTPNMCSRQALSHQPEHRARPRFRTSVEFAIDGQRVRLASFGGPVDLSNLFEKPTDTGDAVDARLRVRVPVKAGPHEVTVAFVQGPLVEVPDRLQPYLRSSVDNFDWPACRTSSCSQSPVPSTPKARVTHRAAAASSPAIPLQNPPIRPAQSRSSAHSRAGHIVNRFPMPT